MRWRSKPETQISYKLELYFSKDVPKAVIKKVGKRINNKVKQEIDEVMRKARSR